MRKITPVFFLIINLFILNTNLVIAGNDSFKISTKITNLKAIVTVNCVICTFGDSKYNGTVSVIEVQSSGSGGYFKMLPAYFDQTKPVTLTFDGLKNGTSYRVAASANGLETSTYDFKTSGTPPPPPKPTTNTNNQTSQQTTQQNTNNNSQNNQNPVNIDADKKKLDNSNSTYTLLAPLPGLDKIETNDIGKYFNIMFKIAIGACGVLAVIMIIINGISYMMTESFTEKAKLKGKIVGPIGGLMIAVGAYVILYTIDPALTGQNGLTVDQVEAVFDARDRADDPVFMKNLDSFSTADIKINPENYDTTFLGYLAHQQGVGGAAAILWSAKRGYAEVPDSNPFAKGNINRNMKSNFNVKSAQKTIGTSTLTPSSFVKYWATKVGAVKTSVQTGKYKIAQNVLDALNKVVSDTSFDAVTLKTICVIESSCNLSTQATTGTYVGLFAISKDVFKNYGKGTDILDPYSNAFAAARLFGSSLSALNSKMPKINAI